MKKILSIALAAMLLALSLVACTQAPASNLAYGKECLALATQLDALNGLVKGDADIAVIDSVMAGYYMKSVDTRSLSLMRPKRLPDVSRSSLR